MQRSEMEIYFIFIPHFSLKVSIYHVFFNIADKEQLNAVCIIILWALACMQFNRICEVTICNGAAVLSVIIPRKTIR